MILLRKKKDNNTYFDFDMILRDGYEIDEQQDVISTKKLANGKRNRYISNNTCL